MLVTALQHINIRCVDLERTRRFYESVVGLKVGDRPPFSSTGYWLYLGADPVVHLVQRAPDETPAEDSGNLDHIAFHGCDAGKARMALRVAGISFRETMIPRDNVTQIFFRDPEGVGLELNFSQ